VTLALSALELELELKRYPQALARVDEAARGSARKELWLLRRGRILEAVGQTEEALATYREALAAAEGSQALRRQNRAAQRLGNEAREAIARLSRSEKGR